MIIKSTIIKKAEKVYDHVTQHLGKFKTGSDLNWLKQLIDLIEDHPLKPNLKSLKRKTGKEKLHIVENLKKMINTGSFEAFEHNARAIFQSKNHQAPLLHLISLSYFLHCIYPKKFMIITSRCQYPSWFGNRNRLVVSLAGVQTQTVQPLAL